MILLWGSPDDSPLAAVAAVLNRLHQPIFCLDDCTLRETEIEWEFDGALTGSLRCGARRWDLSSISAAYLRPSVPNRRTESARHEQSLIDALLCWSEITPAFVINRPSAMASNNSKPYQAGLIQSQGFAIPETLITTDVAAVQAFRDKYGELIYKSVSGVRSIVSRLTSDHLSRLGDIAHCPTQFQQQVAGTDFRVHVVGEEIFVSEVCSEADDYRYPNCSDPDVTIQASRIPAALAERCRCLAQFLQLPLAGIDLRRTADGQWYCFEVNPSPGFTYYEQATGQPISEAIARLLCRPASGERK